MFLNLRKGQGPIYSLVDYKLAGALKLCNGSPNFSRRVPEDPQKFENLDTSMRSGHP